jgi:hypothetical protein
MPPIEPRTAPGNKSHQKEVQNSMPGWKHGVSLEILIAIYSRRWGYETMTTDQVENEALKLKPEARAELAEKLLRSLEDLSDEEIQRLWAEEAVRRDAELDSGTASMRDAEDVFKDARARIS